MDLEKIIECAKMLARPYIWTAFILGGLLVLSVAGNIYLATQEVEIIVDSDANFTNSDYNIDEVKGN